MADEWTGEEAAAHAFEDTMGNGMGICDQELLTKLLEVDRDNTVIFSRLRPAQRIALVNCLAGILDADRGEMDLEEAKAMLHGLSYGFQMGHDYALKHGRLGAE